ncbi:MucR family transcriptional regulator [Rhizobium leguminosarum]|uniref:MucR family transcriptional regulator n=1 Tax=Rhizobium leguminosarum TaxID=384 RepID=UPI001C987E8F|nr:MucR family transcriptional regulator [Rhizobium leguminosarum]MBY5475725.1 MucR family transcriptional regulator [Rhizobium leguminosarum]
MISIDVNALEDLEQVDAAIDKLCKLRSKIFKDRWLKGPLAEPYGDGKALRAKARELVGRDDLVKYATRIVVANTRGTGLTAYQAKLVTRLDELSPEDLDEMNAVPMARSIGPYAPPFMDPQEAIQGDGIICLIDGEKRKFLSRYVRQVHGLEWHEYLRRFDLPDDYPRTSKDVIAQRAKAATERGFGKHDRIPNVEEQVQVTIPVRRTFGRRSVPQQVSVKVDIGGSVNTTAERRKERRLLGGLL